MDAAIRPIAVGLEICGTARTAECEQGDVLASLRTLVGGQPGEVLVVGGLNAELACLGAFMAKACRKRGMVGAVLDGYVRDLDDLLELRFPAFCRGAVPQIQTTGRPGRSNVPVAVGGITVDPGDLVRGDSDGIVVIAWSALPEALKAAAEIAERETTASKRMAAGEDISVLYAKYLS
jgi:4-hydroxy-4-methyl-2-oxoglutarate aldolase